MNVRVFALFRVSCDPCLSPLSAVGFRLCLLDSAEPAEGSPSHVSSANVGRCRYEYTYVYVSICVGLGLCARDYVGLRTGRPLVAEVYVLRETLQPAIPMPCMVGEDPSLVFEQDTHSSGEASRSLKRCSLRVCVSTNAFFPQSRVHRGTPFCSGVLQSAERRTS